MTLANDQLLSPVAAVTGVSTPWPRDLILLAAAFLPILASAVFKVFIRPTPVLGLLLRP